MKNGKGCTCGATGKAAAKHAPAAAKKTPAAAKKPAKKGK